jgi:hypothetical protein
MPGEVEAAEGARLVCLRVSAELLLKMMFRLPEEASLEDASVERDGGFPVLLLTVGMPDAPPDAVSVDVTYTKRNDLPDPVQVTGFRWYREDGSEIGGLMSGK